MKKMTDKIQNTSDNKYLTQMKELPPENSDEEGSAAKTGAEKKVKVNIPEPEIDKKVMVKPLLENQDEENQDKVRLPITIKDIILGIINVICLILLFIILINFPTKARELKNLRLESLKNESKVSFELDKIHESKAKADELDKLFLNDAGVVNFVNELEKIKNEGGAIKTISFANQGPIKDRSGNFGIPVVIEFQGRWEQIDMDLQKLDLLPFLFRAAKVEIGKPKPLPGQKEEEVITDENVVVFKYGIFLYYNSI